MHFRVVGCSFNRVETWKDHQTTSLKPFFRRKNPLKFSRCLRRHPRRLRIGRAGNSVRPNKKSYLKFEFWADFLFEIHFFLHFRMPLKLLQSFRKPRLEVPKPTLTMLCSQRFELWKIPKKFGDPDCDRESSIGLRMEYVESFSHKKMKELPERFSKKRRNPTIAQPIEWRCERTSFLISRRVAIIWKISAKDALDHATCLAMNTACDLSDLLPRSSYRRFI